MTDKPTPSMEQIAQFEKEWAPIFERWKDSPCLRDQFAGAALAGLLANPTTPTLSGDQALERNLTPKEIIAEGAYRLADAMIIEREKK